MRNESKHSYSVRSLIAAVTLLVSLFNTTMSFGQCTIAGSGNKSWDASLRCTDNSFATAASIIIVPVGVTLIFDDNSDTWTGTRIDVYGVLNINNGTSGVVNINSTIVIKPAGELKVNGKLELGNASSPSPCPYTIVMEDLTAKVNLIGQENASDKLRMCGTEVGRGGTGGCNNNYPNGNPSYCEPAGGFYGPFVLGETGATPLPVQLLFFKAYPSIKGVDLKWATASEKGAHYFAIEKSLNGKNFVEIGTVNASGSTISRKDYSYFDDDALLGRNYYRLKAVDFDGTYEYFNITFADADGAKAVNLYPNPVQSNHVQFKLNFASDEVSNAKIYNSTGALVSSFYFSGTHYNEESNLRPGAYILKVFVGKEVFTQRFVIP
jgi:hypothetical protein